MSLLCQISRCDGIRALDDIGGISIADLQVASLEPVRGTDIPDLTPLLTMPNLEEVYAGNYSEARFDELGPFAFEVCFDN